MTNIEIPIIHMDVDLAIRDFFLQFCDMDNIEIEARVGVFRHMPDKMPQLKVSEYLELQETTPKRIPLPKYSTPYLNDVVFYSGDKRERKEFYNFDATVENDSYKRIVLALESAMDHHNKNTPGIMTFRKEFSIDSVLELKDFDNNKGTHIPEDDHIPISGEFRMTEFNNGDIILIKKQKIGTLDIIFPEPFEYGLRIQASEEIPYPLSAQAIEELKKMTAKTIRYKDRVSYLNNWLRFDITRVESETGDIKKIMNQIELEIDKPLLVREAKSYYEAGNVDILNKMVAGFWSNARTLCMAAGRLLKLYTPTPQAYEYAEEILNPDNQK